MGHNEKDQSRTIDDHEERIGSLENIVKGDGRMSGVGPMVLEHDRDLNGDNGIKAQLRSMRENNIRQASWIAGAVAVAVPIGQIIWTLVKPVIGK